MILTVLESLIDNSLPSCRGHLVIWDENLRWLLLLVETAEGTRDPFMVGSLVLIPPTLASISLLSDIVGLMQLLEARVPIIRNLEGLHCVEILLAYMAHLTDFNFVAIVNHCELLLEMHIFVSFRFKIPVLMVLFRTSSSISPGFNMRCMVRMGTKI